MKQRGGCLWLIVGLFLALIAGGLAFTAMLRATSAEPAEQAEPRAAVVVVARDVPPRTKVTAEDLITKEIPVSAIPENAVRTQEEAIDKVTTGTLIAGEILLAPRVAVPGEQRAQVAFEVEAGQVVMAFPANDLMSRTGILQPGDVVDFLYTMRVTSTEPGADEASTTSEADTVTFWSLQRISITALVLSNTQEDQAAGKPQSYLFALEPQDALLLKHLKDTGATLDLVLRAREDDQVFETEPVNPRYLQEEYGITPEDLR